MEPEQGDDTTSLLDATQALQTAAMMMYELYPNVEWIINAKNPNDLYKNAKEKDRYHQQLRCLLCNAADPANTNAVSQTKLAAAFQFCLHSTISKVCRRKSNPGRKPYMFLWHVREALARIHDNEVGLGFVQRATKTHKQQIPLENVLLRVIHDGESKQDKPFIPTYTAGLYDPPCKLKEVDTIEKFNQIISWLCTTAKKLMDYVARNTSNERPLFAYVGSSAMKKRVRSEFKCMDPNTWKWDIAKQRASAHGKYRRCVIVLLCIGTLDRPASFVAHAMHQHVLARAYESAFHERLRDSFCDGERIIFGGSFKGGGAQPQTETSGGVVYISFGFTPARTAPAQ